tara:strand:+ start:16 stop:1434 length:1419 start_codon:yes stop_codon:yes gene_type:complete
MIGSFRNFAKTKFAGLLVFIMIIPFVFWGMGSMFSSGNTNTIAKINKTNISTQEFMDYINTSNITQETIRKNIKNNIIEELLSSLISRTLIELEVIDYNVIISERTLLKKIKENKNFVNKDGNFERIKYEKFLLENNLSAPAFEIRLRGRELQKNLFDYMRAGTVSPQFLINRLYEEENKKIEINFINLKNFYKKKDEFTDDDLKKFINENKDQLKIEYIDFDYAIINPKNLIGIDEYSQSFFDKIDQIEIDISNEIKFNTIVSNYKINPININNFKFSSDKNKIEQKIFELRNNNFDIIEIDNDYILYKINKIEKRIPNLTDNQTKNEILELVYQKNKFDYNKNLLEKIKNKKFNDDNFFDMGQNLIENIKINSNRDNKKFEINAVKTLYSLPVNSFTLINDEHNNIYLIKIIGIQNQSIKDNDDLLNEYKAKQNSNMKSDMLKTYDLYLNKKYNVVLNQKTIERVKNFFQ